MWDSHLPIFPPVDHQPARVVMEGEICQSTSPPAPSVPPHISIMHGAALRGLRRNKCHSQLFSSCFLSSLGRRDTNQEQLFKRNASTNAKHVIVYTTLHLPLFLSLSTLKNCFSVPKTYHNFLFISLPQLLPCKTIIDMDTALMNPRSPPEEGLEL